MRLIQIFTFSKKFLEECFRNIWIFFYDVGWRPSHGENGEVGKKKKKILSPWLRSCDLGFLGWMCPFPSNWTGVNIISQKGESERSEWERDYISLALLLQPFFQPTMMQLHWESARERECVWDRECVCVCVCERVRESARNISSFLNSSFCLKNGTKKIWKHVLQKLIEICCQQNSLCLKKFKTISYPTDKQLLVIFTFSLFPFLWHFRYVTIKSKFLGFGLWWVIGMNTVTIWIAGILITQS